MTLKNLLGISLDEIMADKAHVAKLIAAAERNIADAQLHGLPLRPSAWPARRNCSRTCELGSRRTSPSFCEPARAIQLSTATDLDGVGR